MKLAPLDRDQLARAMWNLYWRGSAQFRDRIEAELDPVDAVRRNDAAARPPDPDMVLAEVAEFTGLARAGAYMYGDRRVTPRERTRWRLMPGGSVVTCWRLSDGRPARPAASR
ncbi:MAG TPA: hypothetical protein VMU94_19110 [Streptosporangiaceae bacterium]|nr:hypothetical protein [Streptosporangiaceae bacterium]